MSWEYDLFFSEEIAEDLVEKYDSYLAEIEEFHPGRLESLDVPGLSVSSARDFVKYLQGTISESSCAKYLPLLQSAQSTIRVHRPDETNPFHITVLKFLAQQPSFTVMHWYDYKFDFAKEARASLESVESLGNLEEYAKE